ncbi:hypothetical protein KCU79_g144, partial [Aureobasidium melanogenum]
LKSHPRSAIILQPSSDTTCTTWRSQCTVRTSPRTRTSHSAIHDRRNGCIFKPGLFATTLYPIATPIVLHPSHTPPRSENIRITYTVNDILTSTHSLKNLLEQAPEPSSVRNQDTY